MASTYTTRVKLAKPATNDTGWGTTVNADLDALDALEPVGGLLVTSKETPSSTLEVRVEGGEFRKADGTLVSYAGTAGQALTASQTNYLYLTDAGVLAVNTSGYPAATNLVRLATVVAGTSTITSVTDDRVAFQSFGAAATADAPAAATYIVQTAHAGLSAEQALSALATGLVKVTTTTGVLSTAAAGTDYLAPAAIGTTVQAWDADLDTFAAMAKTKGNLLVANGTAWVALGVGSNTHVLTADSGEAAGVKWAAGGGGGGSGDVVGPASSVDSEVVLFDSTTGKLVKRATTTGLAKLTSGVLSAASSPADYLSGFADPNADRLVFWDDSAGAIAPLTLGTGLSITGTTIDAAAGGDASTNTASSVDSEIVLFSGAGGKTLKRATTTGLVKAASGVIAAAVAGTDYVTPTGNGSGLTALNGSNISSGTVAAARLGSGTPQSYTPLMGDGTWDSTPTFEGLCTFNAGITIGTGNNIAIGTTGSGTMIGNTSTAKMGFWGKTPVTQPVANADTSGAALAALETEVNEIKALLRLIGLMAT
jgi:hypothetical protein